MDLEKTREQRSESKKRVAEGRIVVGRWFDLDSAAYAHARKHNRRCWEVVMVRRIKVRDRLPGRYYVSNQLHPKIEEQIAAGTARVQEVEIS